MTIAAPVVMLWPYPMGEAAAGLLDPPRRGGYCAGVGFFGMRGDPLTVPAS